MARKQNKFDRVNQRSITKNNNIPDIYREMLAEALPLQSTSPPKASKRRKVGKSGIAKNSDSNVNESNDSQSENLRSNNVEEIPGKFGHENSIINDYANSKNVKYSSHAETNISSIASESSNSFYESIPQQTIYRDFDEDSEESDCEWETVDLVEKNDIVKTTQGRQWGGDLELTLKKDSTLQEKSISSRKKLLTRADRLTRIAIHKMHILCLLSYLEKRNEWCNNHEVQASLKSLLTPSILKFLKPNSNFSQFGRAQSFKRGLEELSTLWRTKFCITERGIKRALWMDSNGDPKELKMPEDTDSVLSIQSFCKAASSSNPKGSRDLGTQLFCAMLRSAGVETRLICSLQPLSLAAGGPYRTFQARTQLSKTSSGRNLDESVSDTCTGKESESTITNKSAILYPDITDISLELSNSIREQRRRLGHPNAADYQMPKMSSPAPLHSEKIMKPKVIRQSPFPVFWVEVFDESHQKWIPVDPLVTQTVAKTRAFEPPASDLENCMSYVIAFDKNGYARDVTRRYAKGFNGKTRKLRVESTDGGERWWEKVMRLFSREWCSDADQIENTELASLEAREPMPKGIADFKGHPYFVLERHLKRNEVIVGAQECGRVAAGRDYTPTNGRKTEKVYRRRDIKVVKSADAWYRLGREVKLGEQPVKVVRSRRKPEIHDIKIPLPAASIGLFTEEQTELYQAPPIINGRVPKNSYGNIDFFVPSMLPRGAVHLPHDLASQAAQIIGIDYAEALVGFEFRGRHGLAILKGIVIAEEYDEAVRAVIAGLEDEKIQVRERIRIQTALRMWKQFILALRIKKRIDSYMTEEEKLHDFIDQDL